MDWFSSSRPSTGTLSRSHFVTTALTLFLAGCLGSDSGGGGGGSSSSSSQQLSDTLSKSNSNPILKVKLTDAPNWDYESVFVNISHIELFIAKGSTEKRLIIGQNMGTVDLLTLQNGVTLPVAEFESPEGLQIREIRLVLNNQGNYGVRTDQSVCHLQTPSGQQSGVKVKLGSPFTLEKDYTYTLVVDFDAKKSVVNKGNGGCLLKPVIKIPAVTRIKNIADEEDSSDSDSESDTGSGSDTNTGDETADNDSDTETGTNPPTGDNDTPTEEPVTDGNDSNVTNPTDVLYDDDGMPLPPDQLGFDINDPSTYPEGITVEDLLFYF